MSPLALASAAVAVWLFARGFVRLRRRRAGLVGWDRVALFSVALAAWLVAFSDRLDTLADTSLSAHMFQHLLIGDVVPALGLLAVRGPLLFFVTPVTVLRAVARSPRTRGVLAFLTRPLPALGIWVATLAVWHVPALYDATLESAPLHLFEHWTFLLGGTLAWIQVVDPARRGRLTTVGRLGFVLGMFVVGQAIATTLVVSPGPIYGAYAGVAARLFGMDALADQRGAGLTMMFVELVALGLAAGFLVRRHVHETIDAAEASAAPEHPLVA